MNIFPIFINMNRELNDFITAKLGLGYIFLTFFDVEHKKEATIVTSFKVTVNYSSPLFFLMISSCTDLGTSS